MTGRTSRCVMRRGVVVSTATLALMSTLVACGGSKGGSPKSAATTGSGAGSSQAAATAAASAKAATFVAAVPSLPPTLDSASFSSGTRPLFTLLDSELFNYADNSCSTAPSSSKLVGQLAKSWTESADGKSYDIVLNNYKSQYGNPLTSTDIQWSLQRGLAESGIVKYLSANSAHYSKTDPIQIISPSEFKLNVDSATPVDLAMFTVPSFAIYDSTEAKKNATTADPWAAKWLATHSDSFGPWQVSAFDQGNQITMTQNPGYTGPRGNVSTLIMKQISSSSDAAQLLQSGSIQYASGLTWAQYKSLQSNSKVTVYPCAAISRDWLVLQQSDPALAKVAVRQAISMAIDRDQLNTGAYSGFGTPSAEGLLPSEIPVGATVQKLTYNVAAAKALLAQAGYPNGFSLTIGYNESQPGSQVDQSSILIQNQLKAIGINVTLDHIASGVDFSTAQQTGKFQAILYYSGSALPDAYFDAGLEEPGSPNDSWGYKDPQWVTLVNQLGSAPVGSAAYNNAAIALANLNVTEVPVVALVDTPNIFAMTSNVSNVGAALRTAPIIPQPAVLTVG